ncbi:hypothetical protein [Kribbella sp. NPDC050459]|uniref:hypothetical protein n=1 Tax=Kribbella sp. NPDC050459 TaxID=3155785 RepID=UPI0033C740F0
MPADELVDCAVDLWGPAADAPSPQAALLGVQRYLTGQELHPDPVVAELVRRLMPWERTGIASLADELALSESQLRRRCLTATGVGPKASYRPFLAGWYDRFVQARRGGPLLASAHGTDRS